MKPGRFHFNKPSIFGASLRYGASACTGFTILISGLSADAGDILRGGRTGSNTPAGAGAGAGMGGAVPASTDAARLNAQNTLARTSQTLAAMRAMQTAAHTAAIISANNRLGNNPANPALALPSVPNGLAAGGLQVAPTAAIDPTQWSGAQLPTQTVAADGRTQVTVKQTTQQALLNWQTFNVGKQTTLTFDQSAGGETSSQWIAFNKVSDPSGNPTQILGSIKADGQVYIINGNGIIFGGSSQVNARNLTASSLPVNLNLVKQGLLNNPDAQFLFSGLSVPGGADGTPNFDPGPPPASGRYGDVTVHTGAQLTSPAASGGNGGRIMLVGPNVTNAGTLSTESGQTILAAGLQVGVVAHDGSDPSLRGLDVWVGALGDYAGVVSNTGLIETLTGSSWLAGRQVDQLGVINSSTSVNLNGRIDLKASYGAVGNPNFDSATEVGAGGPMFINQFTGVVNLGQDSVAQILPDYASSKAVPGTALPERSQVNIEGLAVHFDRNSVLLAPNAKVAVRAGTWPYKDTDGNRTIFDASSAADTALSNYYSGTNPYFYFDAGQIYLDDASIISVAGSADVFVPLSQSILTVQLRGPELADSPLQRDTNLRGADLSVDLRNTGTYDGKYWIGTPLGDLTGLAGLIERNAAQLTVVGGDITLQAGSSVVVGKSATLDVSGGYFQHEGGLVKTSMLMSNGRLVAIKDAIPDRIYDGVFTGSTTFSNSKWGVSETFLTPLFAGSLQQGYAEGAAGGTLSITAAGMALDGTLRGLTVQGPRQRSNPPGPSVLALNFEAEKTVQIPGSEAINYIKYSPTPPAIVFAKATASVETPAFVLVGDSPSALPGTRLTSVVLAPDLLESQGFGTLEIANPDGSITVPAGVTLAAAPKATLTLAAANLTIDGAISAPGGKLDFTTYNISPSFATEYSILNPSGSVPYPLPVDDRGLLVLGRDAILSTSGRVTDDLARSKAEPGLSGASIVIDGGTISMRSYNATLAGGSVIDVSGGVYMSDKGAMRYGKGGAISVLTGTDAGFAGVIGGTLTLGSTLRGYSGTTGGMLSIQASLIQVGGSAIPGMLYLSENTFRTGGFTKYSLTGVGAAAAATPPPGQFESYVPAITIAADTRILPLAENLVAVANPAPGGTIGLQPFVNDAGLRTPVSLAFTALGSDDPFTLDRLEARGDIVMGAGASIITEPGASVSFKGGTVTLLGTVAASGGSISVTGAGTFPLTTAQRINVTQALPTVHLGAEARLSVAGTVLLKPDVLGRRIGTVFGGGAISLSGNIVAENGSLLDAAGTSGILDFNPAAVAGGATQSRGGVSGLTSAPVYIQGIATRVDSGGGVIDLSGSQMLLSDATLRGGAGGPTATGGQLLVSSGRYYSEGQSRTNADINLTVSQTGDVIVNPAAAMGVGIGLSDHNGNAIGNAGVFSLERFTEGSFASLGLGSKYISNATPIPYGGNVEFRGPIDLTVGGALRLAAGGVVRADASVTIHASYMALGQDFRTPQNPDDVFLLFQQDPAFPSNEHTFAPTFGTGNLTFDAALIDVGTLSLQNIGRADLTSIGGDIRGNGTLSIAGDLTLTAAQIYPTSLAAFSIFAYDHAGVGGSVTIRASGSGAIPLSAGGHLAIYASSIVHSGVLRAPMGTIRLGWDATDLDPATSAIDKPYNPIAGSTIAPPVTANLILDGTSITSVAVPAGWLAPFGNSPDGQSWIDPRGVNVTLSGLPEKSVIISGGSVNMQAGAVVDISGGGDLLASRWVAGNGGSMNLLGAATAAWGAGTEYQPGALVTYSGATWSARVRHSGQTPLIGLYWSKVADSYAIIPSASMAVAPYNSFNTGSNAKSLARDPGYVSSGLGVGDTITLVGCPSLPAGTYTLLPRRYAMLPGAFLVTPQSGGETGVIAAPDGSFRVSGYLGNRFNQPAGTPVVLARFKVSSAAVIQSRANYESYSANAFLGGIATQLALASPQQLPNDAGYAALHGNSALRLDGILRTQASGLGATVDVSSFSNMVLAGGYAADASAGSVVLQTSVLSSWQADSLLIGGVRRRDGAGATVLDVRTASITLDNPGGDLSAADVTLVSNSSMTVSGGSSLSATGKSTAVAETMTVTGDGTLLRVSMDSTAAVTRTGVTGSAVPLMTMGSLVKLSGASLILDSTYGTALAADAALDANHLTLGSGQISVVLDGAGVLPNNPAVDPHLVLQGVTLGNVLQAQDLSLRSYRSIDIYGSGVVGGTHLEHLTLAGSGVRGYGQAGGNVVIRATEVTIENPSQAASLTPAAVTSGNLQVDATTIRLGANTITVSGYQDLVLNAATAIITQGIGSFSTAGDLHANTPLITGDAGSTYAITASEAMVLTRGGGIARATDVLGASLTLQAATLAANTDILLPSGQLTLRASAGNVSVGGNLSVAGTSKKFNDLTRYADAGSITVESRNGEVVLTSTATVSVAAASGGGNAGTLNIATAQGTFASAATLSGHAAQGFSAGAFTLDTGSLIASGNGSLAALNSALDGGGFTASREFRVRSGDVTIDHAIHSHDFTLTADQGSILVTGEINASGKTGGSISLAAHGYLTLAPGAKLSVAADVFDSAGKGGKILLEAGTQRDAVANTNALLDLQQGASLDLSVGEYVAGSYDQPGSSAFAGKFTGTLHLRAPRTAANNDLRIDAIDSTISGASSVVAEGFMVYTPAGGVLNIAQRNLINTDATHFLGAAGVGNTNEAAMRARLSGGAAAGLDALLVIAPGVEIINPTGDLTLGLANITGTTNTEALATADWDLSQFRYGARSAPGVLTLRANGDLIFNNTLSDGFTPIAQGSAQQFADNGHSLMWMATLRTLSNTLPANTQSWSYRLTAGADTNSGNFRSVLPVNVLDTTQPARGSVIVGEFYPAIPNRQETGISAAVGPAGQTADTIRISTTTTNRGSRFEVIRTGTGDITISAGRDVQLRNTFSTIYTAGVALPVPTTVFSANDFVLPVLPTTVNSHPGQSAGGLDLGVVQQLYPAAWSMAGGNISIMAQSNIGRYTLVNDVLTVDSSRQMPTNWLYRRGYVDSSTGLFASDGGFGTNPNLQNASNINDKATSTTWWIDYSNFFQGVGTLGGGNVSLAAGHDIVNVDAVAPTNARMPGRMKNPDFGTVAGASEYLNVAPDAVKLLELGGGDVSVTAGRNIDGGMYYVERGHGELDAGGSITTNAARTPSLGILDGSAPLDPLTWLPTTMFVGKAQFDVSARGDIILGPVTNPFLLPQGLNNKYWYKTYFSTYAADAGVTVSSYGGSVTHRTEINLPDGASSRSLLDVWYGTQNLFTGLGSAYNASNFQPWLRLAEADLGTFSSALSLAAPKHHSTSFGGDVNLVGSWTLAPSAVGTLELAATGSIVGLHNTGPGRLNGRSVQVWTSAVINVSDASPTAIPSLATPLAYQNMVGRSRVAAVQSLVNVLQNVNLALNETGSILGVAGSSEVKQALHAPGLLHAGDASPVRLYATGGDITGVKLFSPKATQITARRDITDVAFYLQNVSAEDISLVSAGRDVIPFNENAGIRALANDITRGNVVGDTAGSTAAGDSTSALAGDIQINGAGVLEVISGRNLDLGSGANFTDGTGVGITSIGNLRNPNLPFAGADIIALAGVGAAVGGGPAFGLAQSSMNIGAFIDAYLQEPEKFDSTYWKMIGQDLAFEDLTDEQRAIMALEKYYAVLRDAGRQQAQTGNYDTGSAAVNTMFGNAKPVGNIFTRAREIRTTTGGAISLAVPGGGITMAAEIFGNPLTPPGIVTEYGGAISTFTDGDVSIGQARIFTLRGGDIVMWSSNGNIAAGTSPRTVVTAPPTRVVIDINSADVQTDLGGLATGGGIGVLAAVEGVQAGSVDLIAPEGYVDAGDAGIRVTGNLNISAQTVLNSSNISTGGTSTGTTPAAPSAPSAASVTSASNAGAAAGATLAKPDGQGAAEQKASEPPLSMITVEVIGYGGGSGDEEDKDKDKDNNAAPSV
jgi:filamentous hemagglutinin